MHHVQEILNDESHNFYVLLQGSRKKSLSSATKVALFQSGFSRPDYVWQEDRKWTRAKRGWKEFTSVQLVQRRLTNMFSWSFSPLPATVPGTRWTTRPWNWTLWASQWRRPWCATGAASPRRLRMRPRWHTWRRWRTRSQRRSVSPTCPSARPWTWSSSTSPTASWRGPAGGRAVTHSSPVPVPLKDCQGLGFHSQAVQPVVWNQANRTEDPIRSFTLHTKC